MAREKSLLENERLNAAIGWAAICLLALAAVGSLVGGDLAWTVLALAGVALAVVPPVGFRDPTTMAPWEALVFAALPVASHFLSLPDPFADAATFLAVVAFSLLVVVELQVFSPVTMNAGFAVVLVVLGTMATAGLWTIVQYASDTFLGTALIGSQNATMWDLVIATAISVVAGPLFWAYLRVQASEGGREFLSRARPGSER